VSTLPLEIHELLDRYELLYPEVEELAWLRCAVLDKEVSSIFKLANQHDTDLRKAVLELNVHSLFRVMDGLPVEIKDATSEDLRKVAVPNSFTYIFKFYPDDNEDVRLRKTAVLDHDRESIFKLLALENDDLEDLVLRDNYWKLWSILNNLVSSPYTSAFKNFFINDIVINTDCFSRGQLQSKLWLVEELKKLNRSLGVVFLCAGWYATIVPMLQQAEIEFDRIRSFDLDPTCVDIAEQFNKSLKIDGWRFKAITQDIHQLDFEENRSDTWSVTKNKIVTLVDHPDTIINTSCEHIENFADWYAKIPNGKLVILQTNNYFDIEEHVNCSKDLDEFAAQTPMSKILYQGELDLEKYKRFMRIGIK